LAIYCYAGACLLIAGGSLIFGIIGDVVMSAMANVGRKNLVRYWFLELELNEMFSIYDYCN